MSRGPSVLVKPTSAGDAAVDRALEGIRRQLAAVDFLDGAQLLEDVDLVTTKFTRVPHALGRKPRGYAVVRIKNSPAAAFNIYDDNDNRTDGDRFLYLKAFGANALVSLVVF